ncbi:MAG: hypothetical protein J1E99_04790 [Muribaculaceae bacterium]|nr:hypothetical protein [Muribaculaceae bacterium]
MKKYLRISFMALFAMIALTVISCSKDDDNDVEGGGSSSATIKINGTEISSLLSAVCEEGHLSGEYWVSFSSTFYYKKDMVNLELSVPFNSFSQLKEGQELINYIDISGFYVLSGQNDSNIGFGGGSPRFNDIEGSVKVQKITNSAVTLKFSNFSFTKSRGSDEQDYTMNGIVTYNLN